MCGGCRPWRYSDDTFGSRITHHASAGSLLSWVIQGADGSMHGLHGVDRQLLWIGRGFAGEPARAKVFW
jgi:hypothetical protein